MLLPFFFLAETELSVLDCSGWWSLPYFFKGKGLIGEERCQLLLCSVSFFVYSLFLHRLWLLGKWVVLVGLLVDFSSSYSLLELVCARRKTDGGVSP